MNDDLRRLVSICAIAVACCLGAQAMLVDPARHELSELKQLVAQRAATASAREATTPSVQELTATLEAVRSEAANIEALSQPARDATGLFGRIERVAVDHNTHLLHLSPMGRTTPIGEHAGEMSIAYQISVESSYQDLVQFIDALQSGLGLTRIELIRVIPMLRESEPFVSAQIHTRHFVIDASVTPPTQQQGAG